jgi:hypothetical protein
MEILQIYLTNANFTPENGRVQQWAGQLLMVFKIPRTLHDTQMEILIRHTGVRKAGSYSAYSSSSESDLQSVSSALPQDVPSLPAHSDNANALGFEQLWYGIELLPADTGGEDGHCRSRYLPYVGSRIRKNNIEIRDHHGKTYAAGPRATKPHDIYMFTTAILAEYADAEGMIVRIKEPGVYTVVGHAFGLVPMREGLTRSLKWHRFQAQWSAEELLRFSCSGEL